MGAARTSAIRGRLEAAVAATVVRLPPPAARLFAGRPVRIDGQELDVQVQLALRLEGLVGGFGAAARSTRRAPAGATTPRSSAARRSRSARYATSRCRGRPGRSAPACTSPPAPRPAPLVVYYHGGGHVICDLETHDQPCRFLAREIRAAVLAVDYRLGPEHRFPAAVDDAFAAFRWAQAHAAELGGDPGRVAVAGDSAGGNLAAVVANLAAADGGPAPAFQALLYPVSDYSVKRRSYETFGEGFFLTREEMDWFRDNYFALRGRAHRPARVADPRPGPGGRRPGAHRHRRLRSACATRARPTPTGSARPGWTVTLDARPASSTGSSTRSASGAAPARRQPRSPPPCAPVWSRRARPRRGQLPCSTRPGSSVGRAPPW